MKIKKIIVGTLFFIMGLGVFAYAMDRGDILLIGEILDVGTSNDKIVVEGVIKSDTIYKEKVLVNINNETLIVDKTGKKLNKTDLIKGDGVVIVLNPAMTKSIPPQATAKKIEIYKVSK
ncbi:Protein of unknown function [Clostridium cavendishii DSM 21758]|uniref:DUF5666 domain-containing protein n=1 Tax=Clostridium cavendishii DSM 21758 TaxID=1121302 RepID=A0A1M6IB83_9CLOT|nr:DUF3221 domain-containing protein [Clostridium cavendishii]SHJ31667.1 Protein of unknown function [Clostridium cavendishii DSM 21758]